MKSNLSLGLALGLLFLSGLITAFGALAKLEHWALAPAALTIGPILGVFSIALIGIVLYFRLKK